MKSSSLIRAKYKDCGISAQFLADKLYLSRSQFYNRVANDSLTIAQLRVIDKYLKFTVEEKAQLF